MPACLLFGLFLSIRTDYTSFRVVKDRQKIENRFGRCWLFSLVLIPSTVRHSMYSNVLQEKEEGKRSTLCVSQVRFPREVFLTVNFARFWWDLRLSFLSFPLSIRHFPLSLLSSIALISPEVWFICVGDTEIHRSMHTKDNAECWIYHDMSTWSNLFLFSCFALFY